MIDRRNSIGLVSKFIGTYERLFNGLAPQHISPNEDEDQFWSNLLSLELDGDYLRVQLDALSKEQCLGQKKSLLNLLFSKCLHHARTEKNEDVRKLHAIVTLSILTRSILSKNLAGWEVMEIFAGGVGESDSWFMKFAAMIDEILGHESASAELRHATLQLAIIFMSSINQLSPGAYFLRRNLYPSICAIMKSPETAKYTFEALLLLAVLASFHKTDAAKLNPYLYQICDTSDPVVLQKICWAANFGAQLAIKTYQNITDDSQPTLLTGLGTLLTSLRPDRALSSTPADPPRELFKNQPIEATLALLPVYELLHGNEAFESVLVESLPQSSDVKAPPQTSPLLPLTTLTLSSYILTHASSTSSPRAIAYANLMLNILLEFAESEVMLGAFLRSCSSEIRLCRQRLPTLPLVSSPRPPLCAFLDCCVLWLRHNLHKRLEVQCYINCMQICYHSLWFLQKERSRLEYHWQALWRAIIGVLDFLGNKLDSLMTTGGVEILVKETLLVIELAICSSEIILPSPATVHELIYELVRSSSTLGKQVQLLEAVASPKARKRANTNSDPDALNHVVSVVRHYEDIIGSKGPRTVNQAMRMIASDIEANGVFGAIEARLPKEPPKRAAPDIGFARYACADALSLMP